MKKITGPSLQVHSGWHLRMSGLTKLFGSTTLVIRVMWSGVWMAPARSVMYWAMEDFKFREWFGGRDFRYVGPALPVDPSNDRLMVSFCRRTVSTIWHYHGRCLAGKIVDRNFRVIGIDALRVVDGSIFTVSPGTNPQATLLMLGR